MTESPPGKEVQVYRIRVNNLKANRVRRTLGSGGFRGPTQTTGTGIADSGIGEIWCGAHRGEG